MQNLLQYISKKAFLTPELRQEIQTHFEQVSYAKGEQILTAGLRADYLYFIESGLLHNYYLHEDKEVTSWFYSENHFVTAWHSFYGRHNSYENIECLEDSILYRISYRDFQKLIAEYPAFGNFARELAEEILAILDEFSKSWMFFSAKEKYEIILKNFSRDRNAC